MTTPRAYTPEELREMVLNHIHCLCHYWAEHPDARTVLERCEGLAFSILTMIDGCAAPPAMTLTMDPHPDDKQFHIAEGDNWVEPGMAINSDCMLHELFYPAAAAMAG